MPPARNYLEHNTMDYVPRISAGRNIYPAKPVAGIAGLGQTTTSGDSNWYNFGSYWNTVKDYIGSIQDLGQTISLKQQQLGEMVTVLTANGDQSALNALQPTINQTNQDLQDWWKVKGAIDSYQSTWVQAAAYASSAWGWFTGWFSGGNTSTPPPVPGVSGVGSLGLIPVVLSVAAIAALAIVVVDGMRLYRDYKYQTTVLDAVLAGSISTDDAVALQNAASQSTNGGSLGILGTIETAFTGTATSMLQVAMWGAAIYFGYHYWMSHKGTL